jgi:hypothetical protein
MEDPERGLTTRIFQSRRKDEKCTPGTVVQVRKGYMPKGDRKHYGNMECHLKRILRKWNISYEQYGELFSGVSDCDNRVTRVILNLY